ncbi:hypothetical protein LMG27177_06720 [Paraburkholderia fynbosensis]|uniref:Uncharacterized protein n=1 Tax=Paraburkholderia fynbosensis TaxID=1200993 RepID=A0A6J5GY76_9BURK|nr:hypothetical protein LMG27177_06720 [Paraburkholderia fynbosensis]
MDSSVCRATGCDPGRCSPSSWLPHFPCRVSPWHKSFISSLTGDSQAIVHRGRAARQHANAAALQWSYRFLSTGFGAYEKFVVLNLQAVKASILGNEARSQDLNRKAPFSFPDISAARRFPKRNAPPARPAIHAQNDGPSHTGAARPRLLTGWWSRWNVQLAFQIEAGDAPPLGQSFMNHVKQWIQKNRYRAAAISGESRAAAASKGKRAGAAPRMLGVSNGSHGVMPQPFRPIFQRVSSGGPTGHRLRRQCRRHRHFSPRLHRRSSRDFA